MTDIVVSRVIGAAPATVFSFFTDLERWNSWQGVGGEIDATPGGVLKLEMPGGQVASGRVVEVILDRKVVFSWGWEGDDTPVPPGSTIVVIELEPDPAGTLLRLTHRDLTPPPTAEHHRAGWERYLDRLRTRAEGGDPGPDLPE
jgi:uncharacterized protein YndB with AHSA1/START domain